MKSERCEKEKIHVKIASCPLHHHYGCCEEPGWGAPGVRTRVSDDRPLLIRAPGGPSEGEEGAGGVGVGLVVREGGIPSPIPPRR